MPEVKGEPRDVGWEAGRGPFLRLGLPQSSGRERFGEGQDFLPSTWRGKVRARRGGADPP